MKVYFKEFAFELEQELLTKNNVNFQLSEKPAKLLALFLTNPDKIFSKTDILEQIWQGRAISEQVVFQNISYLRSLFGSDAIKTFVKKGYQWQLAISNTDPRKDEHTTNLKADNIKTDAQTTKAQSSHKLTKRPLPIILLIVFISLLISIIFTQIGKSSLHSLTPVKTTLTILPEQNNIKSDEHIILSNTYPVFKIEDEDQQLNQHLFDSPFKTWSTINKQGSVNSEYKLIIATRTYKLNNLDALRFHIQGKERGWTGYIAGTNAAQRTEKLNQLLHLLENSEYFNSKANHVALSALSELGATQPNNLNIGIQLAKLNVEQGHLNRSLAIINTLLEQLTTNSDESTQVYIGILQLLKANVTLQNTNWQQAEEFIVKAIDIFTSLNADHLLHLSQVQYAWYFLHNNNYPETRLYFAKAITSARAANEPLQEYLAHIYQSGLAGKHNETLLMEHELEAAQQLFTFGKLNHEHTIPMLFLRAALENDEQQKVNYYLQVLNSPFTKLYSQRFYFAANKVREFYVQQQQWQMANAATRHWQRPSFSSLMLSKTALAQKDGIEAIRYAIQAFRQAQLNYDMQDALDSALLLLQYANNEMEVDSPQQYTDFIKLNATPKWLRDNSQSLNDLEKEP